MLDSYQLPLFPLHTVLFPGMPLALHIFEPRYKLMINQCITMGRPFGVVLIAEGSEVGNGATTQQIGTSAAINHVKHYAGGEMDILTTGLERFTILSTHQHQPYLTGQVRPFPLENEQAFLEPDLIQDILSFLRHYLFTLAKIGAIDLNLEHLPEEPTALAYLVAAVLNVPLSERQALLSIPSLTQMLVQERAILYREMQVMKAIAQSKYRTRRGYDN